MPAITLSSASKRVSVAETVGVERVEADRDPVQPGGPQVGGGVGEQQPVGRHREVAQARVPREDRDELREVAAHERLAARQADPVDAELREHAGEPPDLLEVENVAPRQPRVVLLRHAVRAPQVAAVRDGDPQVRHRPAEGVARRHERSILTA